MCPRFHPCLAIGTRRASIKDLTTTCAKLTWRRGGHLAKGECRNNGPVAECPGSRLTAKRCWEAPQDGKRLCASSRTLGELTRLFNNEAKSTKRRPRPKATGAKLDQLAVDENGLLVLIELKDANKHNLKSTIPPSNSCSTSGSGTARWELCVTNCKRLLTLG